MAPIWWLGSAVSGIGIIVTIVVAITRNLKPRLTTRFMCPGDDPAALDCEIRNEGRGVARDVFLTFGKMLPLGTQLFTDPEIRAELIESDTPPDPVAGPATAALQKALAVRIPRIAPRDTVRFQVRTTDPDNVRAAEQIRRIRTEIENIVFEFGVRLHSEYPHLPLRWDHTLILSGRIKDECFFTPLRLSYDQDRHLVMSLSEEEELARASCQDLYSRFKPQFIDLFKNRPEFRAPVIRIKTSAGERTYATFPPYLTTYLDLQVSANELRDKGSMFVYPPIPESYL
jgi:hypothetical protein